VLADVTNHETKIPSQRIERKVINTKWQRPFYPRRKFGARMPSAS
jgi:hypothetical protein